MDERGRDRAEHGEQRPLEPAADPGEVDEDDGEHDGEGLDEDVAAAHVRELVRDHGLELGRAQRPSRPVETASAEPRGPRPAASARG